MSRKVQLTAAFAAAATMVFTMTGAFAQDPLQSAEYTDDAILDAPGAAGEATNGASPVQFISQAIVQPLPQASDLTEEVTRQLDAASLGELVAGIPVSGEMSRDMRCLASAIYFEARGEPLLGQLAVGRVIVNRAASGRFPSSYCGVVYQRSQFSFVRKGSMPSINMSSRAWRKARAIAKIADESLWESPAKGALFFHAASVEPSWRLTRVGRVSSHVFYR